MLKRTEVAKSSFKTVDHDPEVVLITFLNGLFLSINKNHINL